MSFIKICEIFSERYHPFVTGFAHGRGDGGDGGGGGNVGGNRHLSALEEIKRLEEIEKQLREDTARQLLSPVPPVVDAPPSRGIVGTVLGAIAGIFRDEPAINEVDSYDPFVGNLKSINETLNTKYQISAYSIKSLEALRESEPWKQIRQEWCTDIERRPFLGPLCQDQNLTFDDTYYHLYHVTDKTNANYLGFLLLKIHRDTLEILDGSDKELIGDMTSLLKDRGNKLAVTVPRIAQLLSFWWNLGFEPQDERLRHKMMSYTPDQKFSLKESRTLQHDLIWSTDTEKHDIYIHVENALTGAGGGGPPGDGLDGTKWQIPSGQTTRPHKPNSKYS
jgi:hypothetical protein